MFLSFSEYKLLGGKTRDEPSFNRAELKARMKINSITFNRLRNEDPVRKIVKQLVLELIETGYCGSLDGLEKSSVSNEGRSASYETNEGKADALIKEWLANEEIDGIPLINRGGIQFAKVVRA